MKAEAQGNMTLRWDQSRVAPVMTYLEERTLLEKNALDIEYSRLMSYGDGECSSLENPNTQHRLTESAAAAA